ncbi:MAG: FG-GAP-like repeat-containing protein, partial [Gammaproteobacteria bacterium]|nr:FG-GAP-like repeat-containing protein [Gammaproteobacteria bacterium]
LESGTIRYVYLADSFQREAIEFVDYKIAVPASNTELDGRLSIAHSEVRAEYVLNLTYSDSSRVVYGFDDLRIPIAAYNPEKSYEGRITIGESRYLDVNLMERLAFTNFDEKAYPVRGAFTLSSGVESLQVTTIDGHQVHLELKDEKENVRLATLEWKDLVVESLPLDSGERPQARVDNATQLSQIEYSRLTDVNSFVLNGKSSLDPEGDFLGFEWRIIEAPDYSTAKIQDSNRDVAQLLPDKFGIYKIGLIVRDATQGSTEYQFDIGIDSGIENINIESNIVQTISGLDEGLPVLVSKREIEIDGSGTSNGYSYIQFSFSGELKVKPEGSTLVLGSFDKNSLRFIPDVPGRYEIVVTASDGLYKSERLYKFDVENFDEFISLRSSVVGATYGVVGERMSWQVDLDTRMGPQANNIEWKIVSAPEASVAVLEGSGSSEVDFVADVAGHYAIEINASSPEVNMDAHRIEFYIKPLRNFKITAVSDIRISPDDQDDTASLPYSMMTGDVDNDGIEDVVMPLKNYRMSWNENRYLTLFGLSGGGFSDPVYNSINYNIESGGSILDLDGDNSSEIIFSTAGRPQLVKVYEGRVFLTAGTSMETGSVSQAVLADFNNNGFIDYVTYRDSGRLLCISWQGYSFSFSPNCTIANIPTGGSIVGVLGSDVDKNDKMDIVLAVRNYNNSSLNKTYYSVLYFPFNGYGALDSAQIIASNLEGGILDDSFQVVDIDADGDVDIVNAGHYWIQTGDNEFLYGNGKLDNTPEIFGARDLIVTDLDGDTDLDIFFLKESYVGKSGMSATIIFQTSPGIFGDGEEFLLGTDENYQDFPYPIPGVSAKDVDGDGDMDILITGASARVNQARMYMLENLKN